MQGNQLVPGGKNILPRGAWALAPHTAPVVIARSTL